MKLTAGFVDEMFRVASTVVPFFTTTLRADVESGIATRKPVCDADAVRCMILNDGANARLSSRLPLASCNSTEYCAPSSEMLSLTDERRRTARREIASL
jgi:hypothetical protein